MNLVKSLKCNRCDKTVDVDDNFNYKMCPICREKDKARRGVLSENKKLTVQLDKNLQITSEDKQSMPKMLWSFSDFIEAYESQWHKKPSHDEYENRLATWKKQRIQIEADIEITESKSKLIEAKKLLRFDIWEKTSKQCEPFRLSKILKRQETQETLYHADECESCRNWLGVFEENQVLTLEEEQKAWSGTSKDQDDDSIGVERHQKDITTEALKLLLNEPTKEPREVDTSSRDYIKSLQKQPVEQTEPSTLEGEQDTERIVKTSKDKLKQWLETPEQDEET